MCYVKAMRRRILLSFLFSLLLVCSFCGKEPQVRKEGKLILEIGERKIYSPTFESFVAYNLGKEDVKLDDYVKSRLLDHFIEEQLLLLEARKNNVLISNSELKEAIRAIEKEAGSQGGHFTRTFYQCLRDELTVKKYLSEFILADITVGYQEVNEYYLAHQDEFVIPEEVRVAQIFLTDEKKAKQVYRELRGNPKKFQELAKKYSESPDATQGGEMGYFRRGQLPPEFERAIFRLRPGRFTRVIQSPYGYHIFLLEEKKEGGRLSEEEVRDNIRLKLLQKKSDERLSRYLKKLKSVTPLKIYTENLGFKYIAPRKGEERNESK